VGTTSTVKRDRENATIVVKNLPPETTETRVRQYFRDVSVSSWTELSCRANVGGS